MSIALASGPHTLQNKTSETVTVFTTGFSASAGQVVTLWVVAPDNVPSTTAVSDSQSNTWQQDAEHVNSGDTYLFLFSARIASPLGPTDTVTIDFDGVSASPKAAIARVWSGMAAAGWFVDSASADAGTTTPSIAMTPSTAGSLVAAGMGVEGPGGDGFTDDTDTTDGSWAASGGIGTTGGSATSNQTVHDQAKIVTGTSGQTWNPILGTVRNTALIIAEYGAAAGGAPASGSASTVFTFAAPAAGRHVAKGAASTTWAFASTAAGRHIGKGAAATGWSFAAPATGSAAGAGNGSASTTFAFTAAATGRHIGKGTAGVAFTFTASAAGRHTGKGSATTAFGFTAAIVLSVPVVRAHMDAAVAAVRTGESSVTAARTVTATAAAAHTQTSGVT